MTSAIDLTKVGKELGLSGMKLLDWIDQQQANEREQRAWQRLYDKERQEMDLRRIDEEREKLAAEADVLEKKMAMSQERTEERELERNRLDVDREQLVAQKELLQLQMDLKEKELEVQIQKAEIEAKARMETAKSKSKLPAFNPKTDQLDSYIKRFERHAIRRGWAKEDWAGELGALLKGEALDTYTWLPPSQAEDYDALKASLMTSFNLTEEGYEREFKYMLPKTAETFRNYLARLDHAFDSWITLSGIDKSYDELKALIVRQQLVSQCNSDLQVFIREKHPKSTDEALNLAERYREARRTTAQKLCRQPRTPGQTKFRYETSGDASTGYTQGKPGMLPTSQDSPAGKSGLSNQNQNNGSSRGMEQQKADRSCYNCGRKGHEKRDCRFPKIRQGGAGVMDMEPKDQDREADSDHEEVDTEPEEGPEVVSGSTCITLTPTTTTPCSDSMTETTCTTVTSSGQTSSLLEIIPAKVNGAVVPNALRDSGCNSVVVHHDLVQPDQYTGRTITCRMIDSSLIKGPEVRIYVECTYYTGYVTAMALKKPVYPLVLGNIPEIQHRLHLQGHQNERTEAAMAVQTRAQVVRDARNVRPLKVPLPAKVDVTPDKFRDLQKSDGTLRKNWDLGARNAQKQVKDATVSWNIDNGILYRHFKSPKIQNDRVFTQLVVPAKLRTAVMSCAHDSIFGGHLGTRKTANRIKSNFYWPGIEKDVKQYCRSCDICQRTTAKGWTPVVPLGKMPIIETPFERIAMDLVGPLPPTEGRKNQYILTVVDFATRYPEAVPLKNIDSETVAEALLGIYSRVGIPKEILTDQGSQFVSDVMKEVSKLLSIKQLATTPYHPMTNGLCERFNGTIKRMLKRVAAERPRDWDRYLVPLLFAFREVPQESLGFSPFELMYGWPVRGLMEVLSDLWVGNHNPEVRNTYQYVLELREKLQESCRVAHDNLKAARAKHKAYYDVKARNRLLKVGDKVLILLPTDTSKLLSQWKGPYEVTQKLSNLDYKVNVNGAEKVYHINLLKKYHERVPYTAATCVGVITEDTEGQESIKSVNTTQKEFVTDVDVNSELTETQQEEIWNILEEFQESFSDVPGRTQLLVHDIKITDPEPFRQKAYPVPFSLLPLVEAEVNKMLELGVIEYSDSPYCSPYIMVKKSDGSNRFCVDLRKLNSITVFDAEPMPDVEEIFVKLQGKKFFTEIDLASGYWQIPLTEGAKGLTAFSTAQGHFQFVVMPFGVQGGPSTFSRLMRRVLQGAEDTQNFLDNVIIATNTWEQHVRALAEVLGRLANARLHMRPTKCHVAYWRMRCLGFEVDGRFLYTQDEKIEVIVGAPAPTRKKQVRSFVGMVSFYSQFVPNFSDLTAPLTDLTRKGLPNQVRWTEVQQVAFDTLKKILTTKPILKLPNLAERFYLRTDASSRALGACLLQEVGGVKLPVAYASKKLKDAERKYSTVERECYAVVWGVSKFARYLYGTEFTLETDHCPLKALTCGKLSNARLLRWALSLQPYRFQIVPIKGRDNHIADYLSRMFND